MKTSQSWPCPAYFSVISGSDDVAHEPAVLMLTSGERLVGRLTRLLLATGSVEFLPERSPANVEFPLDKVQELRLLKPIALARKQIPALAGVGEAAPDRQPFMIELSNDDVLSGETVGFEAVEAGLFLFISVVDNVVLRSFIPTASIRKKQIGAPIGEILENISSLEPGQVASGLDRQRELRDQKLGDCLTDAKVISPEALDAALERQRSMPMMRLGEALLQLGIVGDEELQQALAHQKENRKKPLGEILVELGHISKDDLKRALTQKLGIPFIDLKRFPIDHNAVISVAGDIAHEFCILPLAQDGGSLIVAMVNPLDGRAIEKLRFMTGMNVVPVMAAEAELVEAVDAAYGPTDSGSGDAAIEELASQLGGDLRVEEAEARTVTEHDNTLVRLVNKTILDAFSAGVSDIHVECSPGKKQVVVRFRKDGVMQEYIRLPANFRSALVSRIKIMANLDISEHRHSQDGRIAFQKYGPANIELRVAIVPTLEGLEDVVMRILAAGEPLPLAKLALRPPVLEPLRTLSQKSFGLLLVCGPTGSGKTTTLHSLLAHINTPERKIWTAEDPIEITQAGLRQVQVNARIGWSFADAMRAFLRADPDVVMVGEMRDEETARMGIEASLTGHLVLSTLHTNSAPESVVRLLQMGMDPFNFADSLAGVLAQRLTRRLCPTCSVPEVASQATIDEFLTDYCHDTPLARDQVLAEWQRAYGPDIRIHNPVGCDKCRQSGYRGRLGIHELLVNSPAIRMLIQQRGTASQIRAAAIEAGMRTLKQDGIEKCFLGLTDIREVRAACS